MFKSIILAFSIFIGFPICILMAQQYEDLGDGNVKVIENKQTTIVYNASATKKRIAELDQSIANKKQALDEALAQKEEVIKKSDEIFSKANINWTDFKRLNTEYDAPASANAEAVNP